VSVRKRVESFLKFPKLWRKGKGKAKKKEEEGNKGGVGREVFGRQQWRRRAMGQQCR
jgi:hypothetical protein